MKHRTGLLVFIFSFFIAIFLFGAYRTFEAVLAILLEK
jgi:preprotein translocase subunit SecE